MNKKRPNFFYSKSIAQELLCNIGTDGIVLNEWVEIDEPIHRPMSVIIKKSLSYAI